MAVRRQGGRWVVEFQQSGSRVFRRLPAVAAKGDAIALEVRLRREILAEEHLGRKAEPSLAAAVQLWLEQGIRGHKDQRKPAQNAVLLAPYIEGKRLREAPEAAHEAMAAWQDLASATINRRLAVLKAACRFAYHQGWIADNLSGRIRPLREENRREVYLTAAQVRMLATKAPTRACRAAIMIAAYSGLRASELLRLGPVPIRAASFAVPTSKAGRPRQVPIATTIRRYLPDLPLGLSYWQLEKQFVVTRQAAGLSHVRFHDLRHTTASLLINAGVDLYTVGAILGHRSTQTTARYSHLADRTLQRAMRKIG